MKKLFSLLMISLALPAFADEVEVPVVDGVYQISTAEQLVAFSKLSNDAATTIDWKVVLTNDIDMDGYTMEPISKAGNYNYFGGEFDGQNHCISNLSIDGSENYYSNTGLIGYAVNGAVVKNVGLKNINFIPQNGGKVGLVAYSKGITVSNCYVEGGTISGYGGSVGGIVGMVDHSTDYQTTITDCHNSASITCTNSSGYVGGIVGWFYRGELIVNRCYNEGTLSSEKNGTCLGGICGYDQVGGEYYNCYNIGEVAGAYANSICGGIFGHCAVQSTVMTSCYNMGTITSSNSCTAYGPIQGSGVLSSSYCYGVYALECTYGSISLTGYSFLSSESFTSGELCYLLQEAWKGDGCYDGQAWGQDLTNGDSYPTLTSDRKLSIVLDGDAYRNPYVYNIEYSNVEGATFTDVSEHIEGYETTLPTDVELEGYTFMGWTNAQGEVVTTISADDESESFAFTATWNKNTVSAITEIDATKSVVGVYSLGGTAKASLTKGLNIVRYSDGTSARVLVR